MQWGQIYRCIFIGCTTKNIGRTFEQLALSLSDLVGVQLKILAEFGHRFVLTQSRQGYPGLEHGRVRCTAG